METSLGRPNLVRTRPESIRRTVWDATNSCEEHVHPQVYLDKKVPSAKMTECTKKGLAAGRTHESAES
jgi:hypothetical protein